MRLIAALAVSVALLACPVQGFRLALRRRLAAAAVSTSLALGTQLAPADAVSGGGMDFASSDISGKDFSRQSLVQKDFSGALALNTNFRDAKLRACRFFKTNLKDADFAGADMTGAALEQAQLEGASFENAVLESAYFTTTIEEARTITGADFTDAIMPERAQKALCERSDAKGTNPTTGVDTRDSLLCP